MPKNNDLWLEKAAEIESLQSRIAELESQLAEAKNDAERYRWLRHWWFNGPEGDIRSALCSEELDAAIDAAMTSE